MNIEDELVAIIVTFNPLITELNKNLSRYLEKIKKVIIVDNGSKNSIEDSLLLNPKIKIIRLKKNVGIAKAQNIGIEFCQENDLGHYYIFFDQDSYLSSVGINRLFEDYLKYDKGNLGLLAPDCEGKSNGVNIKREVISSGSIISRNTLEKVGRFKENLFIDFVDYEYCWRLWDQKYKVCIDSDVHLIHQTGKIKKRAGKIVSAPFRNYYVFRNIIYLSSLKYGTVKFRSIWTYRMMKRIVFELVFCPRRGARLRYIVMGINDGIYQKMGELKYLQREGN